MLRILILGVSIFSTLSLGVDKLLPNFPVYAQPDGISCGPASASMVLKYYHHSAGIGPLKTKANTRWFTYNNYRVGMTHPNELASAIEQYFLGNTVYSATTQDLVRFVNQGRPTIVLLRSGRDTWHYVVVVGYLNDGKVFTVADPASGGYTHNMTAAQLNGAWRFSHDMSGNYIPDPKCGSCHGSGKAWTKCVTCGGSGKIKGPFGSWTQCTFCSGQGKWSGKCPLCGGKGTTTDGFRKVVEFAGAKGNTAIVPDYSSPEVKGDRFGIICLSNQTQNKVNYRYQWGNAEWKSESIEPGVLRSHYWKYPFVNENSSPNFNIRFDANLTTGNVTTKQYVVKRTASSHVDCKKLSVRDTFKYTGPNKAELELYHSAD
jgi:hypothetical protein